MNADIQEAPATSPANPFSIRALLWSVGYGATIAVDEPRPGQPVTVRYTGPASEHTAHVAGVKRILEDNAYDLATRGPRGNHHLLVYARYDTALVGNLPAESTA